MLKPNRPASFLIVVSFLSAAGLAVAQESTTTHVVAQDETLAKIATQYFGNAFSWPLIWEANKDKVQDPHWVYPGQELVIPPLSAAGPVGAPDTSKPDTVAVTSEPAPAETVPAAVEPEPEPEPAREEPAAKVRQIGLVAKLKPVVSEEMALKGGYISPVDEKPLGHIVAFRKDLIDKEHLYTNEKIYINLGARDGVKAGDRYAIYRQSGRVKHPVTKKAMGRKIQIVGMIQVDEAEERTAGARIVKCYQPLGRKEAIKPYLDVIIPTDLTPLPATKALEGYIIAFAEPREMNTLNEIVYIDRGTADGIMPGDVFEIYRPQNKVKDPDRKMKSNLPAIVLGDLQVLAVRNGTATAYVNSITIEGIKEGDHIRLVKQIPK
ncbi:MAG: LysM peptidoglycan-binding domain-containing protein [Candidatus Edwardsbacteria bacterium]|nr:LysM peptidoglycan-binding domain-containing protein [Candidatus Edwardsbacteria bacterium]